MRLPTDPENWTGHHADKAIERAWKLFQAYEAKINFTWPMERQDELYRPYLLAREEAINIARYNAWRSQEAEALP